MHHLLPFSPRDDRIKSQSDIRPGAGLCASWHSPGVSREGRRQKEQSRAAPPERIRNWNSVHQPVPGPRASFCTSGRYLSARKDRGASWGFCRRRDLTCRRLCDQAEASFVRVWKAKRRISVYTEPSNLLQVLVEKPWLGWPLLLVFTEYAPVRIWKHYACAYSRASIQVLD